MTQKPVSGPVVEKEVELTLAELGRLCGVRDSRVLELVEEGIVEPSGPEPAQWRFRGVNVWRVRCAVRLERDLGVNFAGAALALDLLDELDRLRARLNRFENR